MEKKKVLIIFTVPLALNGIYIATLESIRAMDRDRFEFYILSAVSSTEEAIKEFENADCTILKEEYRNKKPLKYYRALKRIIRENGIEIVHAMGNSGTLAVEMLAAKRAEAPIRIAHSHNTSCRHKIFDKLLRPVLYGSCNYRIACGKDAGKWLFKNRDFIVLKNGKQYDKYAFDQELRERYRKEYLCGDNTLVIGHVGRFDAQKNHPFIVGICEQLKKLTEDFKIVFFGDGEKLESTIRAFYDMGLKDKAIFSGAVKNVNERLSACDVMILPSLYEGLPNVAVEWQINGLPCFISDKVTRECKISENVVFLPIDDPKVWAEEIFSGRKNRNTDVDGIKESLKEKGFDLYKNAIILSRIYDGSQTMMK